jgi:hypothetical protein
MCASVCWEQAIESGRPTPRSPVTFAGVHLRTGDTAETCRWSAAHARLTSRRVFCRARGVAGRRGSLGRFASLRSLQRPSVINAKQRSQPETILLNILLHTPSSQGAHAQTYGDQQPISSPKIPNSRHYIHTHTNPLEIQTPQAPPRFNIPKQSQGKKHKLTFTMCTNTSPLPLPASLPNTENYIPG